MINGNFAYYIDGNNSKNIIDNTSNKPNFIHSPVQGYYINAKNNVIECNGNICSVYNRYEECKMNKIGSINRNFELCANYDLNSGKEIKINTSSNGKYMVTISDGMFPGNLIGAYLLNFSNNIINVIFNEDDIIAYYLISDELIPVSTIDTKGTLYRCQGKNACVIEYSEGTYPNGDINTVSIFQKIICYKKDDDTSECISGIKNQTEQEVYCLANVEDSYLYLCNNNCNNIDESDTSCKKEIANKGYYIPYFTNQLIYCKEYNKCNYETEISSGYYTSGILNQPLIHCVDSLSNKSCNYIIANDGFYPSNKNNHLIKCLNRKCSLKEIITENEYYLSGENDKVLITCTKKLDLFSCISYSKLKPGWYINGDPDKLNTGNILIKCDYLYSIYSCHESRALNDGYLINAGSDNELINSSNGKIEEIKDGYYYVNGETKKLLYCTYDISNKIFECNDIETDIFKSYYKINPYIPDNENNNDDEKIIVCTKSKICSYYNANQMKNGYYINSDDTGKNKSYPLIYNDGNKFSLKMANSRGWYFNADVNAETNEKIIECKSNSFCERKGIENTKCSSQLNGKFTSFYEDIKWCNNNNEISIPINKKKEYTIFVKYVNELIPGLIIKEKNDKLFISLYISNDSILQNTDEDGYIYINDKLFFCNDKFYGKCEEVNIVPGYYFNYKNIENVIKCDSDISCEIINFSEKNQNDDYIYNCNNSNIIYYEKSENDKYIKICNDKKGTTQSLKEININLIYAFRVNLKNKFPGATGRYALVNVNKYYMKFKTEISELSDECPSISSTNENDNIKYCLKNEKLYRYTNIFSPDVYNEPLQINSYNIKDKILYDYDTNDGFFIYNYCSNYNDEDYEKSLLTKVYIDNESSKYECDIGHSCTEKKKADIPIIGYIIDEDGILKKKDLYDKDTVVEENIYESRYLSYNKTNSFIKCYNGGYCENDISNDGLIQYDKEKMSISVKVNNNEYESNLIRPKYIFKNINNSLNKRSINSERYGNIYELTSVYFKIINETRNIFLNENYEIISNEDEQIKIGYKCYKANCYEIQCGNNEKYYLNTIQVGKSKNAVVRCKNNKFEMIHCNEYSNNIYYENAAAKYVNETIILCSSKSCKISISNLNGELPQCKLGENGKINENNVCIRDDNSSLLNEGQHCLFYDFENNKKKIYVTTEENKCEQVEKFGIHLYDVTLKELEKNNIEETHYNALMYICPYKDNCYQTYGYIVNNSNGYSRCSSEGCIYNNLSLLKSNCGEAGVGNLINNSGEVKICISNNQSISLSLSNEKYFHLSININNGYPETFNGNEILININNGISYIIVDEYYILINNENSIIKEENTNENNKLYKCNSEEKTCMEINSIENGYYYSYLMEDLYVIKCDNTKCISINKPNTLSFIKDYYLYWGEKNENPFPGNDNSNILTYSDGISIKKYNATDFILLKKTKLATENESEPLKDLYRCNNLLGNCNKIEKIYDGWYVSGDNNYKAIKCINEECLMVKELPSICNNEGDFIYNNNIYYICVDKTKYNLNKISGNSYYLKNNHNFLNKKNYIVSYSNYVIGIANISNSADFNGLSQCKNIDFNSACTDNNNKKLSEGEYCIKLNKIYRTYSNKCIEQFASETSVYLFIRNNLITMENINNYENEFKLLPNGIQMYYCKNGNCNVTTGYYKFDSNKICRCEFTGCILLNNQGNKYGDIKDISSGELIHSNGIGNMISGHYYFIEDINNFPGSENLKSFLVEAGNNYYIIFNGNGYYLINNDIMENTDPENSISNKNKRSDFYNADKITETYLFSKEINNKTIENKNIHLNFKNFKENYLTNKSNNAIDNIKRYSKRIEIRSNILYYCNGDTRNCEVKDNLTGYFVNSGSINSNFALIECNFGDCMITKNIDYGEKNCGNDNSVKLIRYNDKSNYKLCMNKNGKKVIEFKINNPINYYILTLGKGDIFPGFNIYNNNITGEIEINIIIISSSEGTKQFTKTGYIVFSNNEIIENLGGKGYLYYCENNSISESIPSNVYCNSVNEKYNGIFFNKNIFNDKRYIKCTEGLCMIMEAIESISCNSSGSLIYNNESHKLCIQKEIQIDISNINHKQNSIMNVEFIDDFPGLKKNNTNILVNLDNEKILYTNLTTYLITYNNNNTIIEDDITKGKLHECNSGICNSIDFPNDGFYKYYDNGLIYCKDYLCIINKNVNEGFYLSGNDSKPLIQCILPNKESSIFCTEKDYIEGWYLNADYNNNKSKPMILCNMEKGCQEKSVEYPGWYLNNAINKIYDYGELTNSKIYPIIQCTSKTSCEIYKEDIENACKKNGDIIYSGDKNKNIFKICKNNIKTIDFNTLNEVEYQIINIKNYNDIPGTVPGDCIVRITNFEITALSNYENTEKKYYFRESNLYLCSIYCEKVIKEKIIIFEEITKNLISSSYCNNNYCEWQFYSKEGYVFIDKDDHLITNENQIVDKLFKCKKNNNNNLICYDMKNKDTGIIPNGFYYNNEIRDSDNNLKNVLYKHYSEENKWTIQNINELKKCTYYPYKNNTCYISFENEDYYDDSNVNFENPIINAESICITKQSIIYFTISEVNTGIDEMNCIKLPSDKSVNYYSVNNKTYAADKFSFYDINEKNLINSLTLKLVDSEKTKFSGILKQGDSNINKYTLSCNSGQCIKELTKFCTYDFQSGTCKSTKGTIQAGMTCTSSYSNIIYLILENISNTLKGKCLSYTENESLIMTSESTKIEFLDRKYVEINNSLYYINSKSEVYLVTDGIYILNKWKYKVNILPSQSIEVSSNSEYNIYICNNGICKGKENCENGDLNEYIYDKSSKSVYQCNPSNQKLSIINHVGYYLNYPSHDLIQCYIDFNYNIKCINWNNYDGMEGYYINAGNNNKIIKCFRDEELFSCSEENIIKCNYDSTIEKCQSDTDLLRNSYCYYNNEDSEHFIYIKNFIGAGNYGDCIINDNNDYYIENKNSKFLGHEERNGLIKFSSNSIVSIYEPIVGYYIISTETKRGIEDETLLNKSRMYKCEKQNCIEKIPENIGDIYVNKASSERMITYSGNKWNVIRHRCKIKHLNGNKNHCVLSSNVLLGDIIYISDSISVKFYYITINSMDDKNPTISNPTSETSKHIQLVNGYYQYVNNDKKLYKLSNDGQIFEIQRESGYYIFNTDRNYNMEGYHSSVNRTSDNENYSVYYLNENNEEFQVEFLGNNKFTEEGYYWNKADVEKSGIALQIMKVPPKVKTEDTSNSKDLKKRDLINNTIIKFKFLKNKCISNNENICVNTQVGEKIQKGSSCVVVDGIYRGLYLATDIISSSSSTINCIKFTDTTLYEYTKNKIEFAGEPINKMLIKVDKDTIKLLKHNITDLNNESNYEEGYFIINNNKKLLNSSIPVKATAYQCGINYKNDENNNIILESATYECNPFSKPNTYLYSNSQILYNNGKEWYNETKFGYYFYNDKNLGATIDNENIYDEIIYGYNIFNMGIYINSMVVDKTIIINYNEDGTYNIETNIQYCIINNNGTCKPKSSTDELVDGRICYDEKTKKLYVVKEIDTEELENKENESLYMCQTGSENDINYYYKDNRLYRMDGLSVQYMKNGYYIFNEKWKGYDSNYPEEPYKLIKCEVNNCEIINNEEFNINSDVVINELGINNNKLIKYFKEGDKTKFLNANHIGYYFFNRNSEVTIDENNPIFTDIYEINENGYLNRLNDTTIKLINNDNNIYINYAKNGSFIRNGEEYKSKLLTNDQNQDKILYDKIFNGEYDNSTYIFLKDNSLYRVEPIMLVSVEKGIYALKNDKAFTKTEWTILNINKEICYYDGEKCSSTELFKLMNSKYLINKANANDGISIIEYNYDNDKWRVVKDDGYYFFYENDSSITEMDCRINKVIRIVDGIAIDVTHTEKFPGYFIFENLMIEYNDNKWEDAKTLVNNVDVVLGKQCTSKEKNQIIDMEGFCYNEEKGLCVVKNVISDTSSNINNCIFTSDSIIKYYYNNGHLHRFNKQMNQRINQSGIYIINNRSKMPYDSRIESKTTAITCDKEICKLEENLNSQYYLNIASIYDEKPIILRYQSTTKEWSKTIKNGYYFFNKKGYPVSENEKATYCFIVKNNGNTIENIKNNNQKGIYVNQSNPSQEIVVINNGTWIEARAVPKCKYNDNSGEATSEITINEGDICLNEKQIVLINSSSRKNNNEYIYDAIALSNSDSFIYSFIKTKKETNILKYDSLIKVEVNGTIVIDDTTKLALNSTLPINASSIMCINGNCELKSNQLTSNKYYINEISNDFPFVQYKDNNQWKIVDTEGYYFMDENMEPVVENSTIYKVIKVIKNNKNYEQYELSTSKTIGFYLNKANNNKNIMIKNNGNYWMKGESVHLCDVSISKDSALCKTLNQETKYNMGDYCYSENKKQLFLLTDSATFESDMVNCVYGTSDNYRYLMPDITNNLLNGITIPKILIELTNESIALASPGYYILNENGEIINDDVINLEMNDNNEINIYMCTSSECQKEYNYMNNAILSVTGKIYEYNNKSNKLIKTTKEGVYFFKEDGSACTSEDDKIVNILRVINVDENDIIIEKINENDLKEDVYVNEANPSTIAVYNGKKWNIQIVNCQYDNENGECKSYEVVLENNNYCVSNGELYAIINITDKDGTYITNKCIPGSEERSIYINNTLIKMKAKSVKYIKDEGYYIFDDHNNKIFMNKETENQEYPLVHCQYNGDCNLQNPSIGFYINKLSSDYNIVQYHSQENIENLRIVNNTCSVKDENQTCYSENGILNEGDGCLFSNSLYFFANENQCTKVEETTISYQFINNTMYRLHNDAILQLSDGYYFVNARNKPISDPEDYSKFGTSCYICSEKGSCYLIKPGRKIKYFPDYASKQNGMYKLIKYDPNYLKSARDISDTNLGEETVENNEVNERKNSGYRIVDEEEIYKMDDRYYSECEINDFDEIECQNVNRIGALKTIDDEVILCDKNDKEIIECKQAKDGGYYIIDNTMYECDPNIEGNQLKCSVMKKEGYFISYNDETLYECKKNINDSIDNSNEISPTTVKINERETNEYVETNEKVTNEYDETLSTSIPNEELIEEDGLEVLCKPIECILGDVKYFKSEEDTIEMYKCKKLINSGENKWVSPNCDSGNYIKDENGFYQCENEKENISEEYIKPPNDEHTVYKTEEITTEISTTENLASTEETTNGVTTEETTGVTNEVTTSNSNSKTSGTVSSKTTKNGNEATKTIDRDHTNQAYSTDISDNDLTTQSPSSSNSTDSESQTYAIVSKLLTKESVVVVGAITATVGVLYTAGYTSTLLQNSKVFKDIKEKIEKKIKKLKRKIKRKLKKRNKRKRRQNKKNSRSKRSS